MGEHSETMAQAREGLADWQRGDISALARLFDPDVELLWWSPGDWDCHGMDAVMLMLTERVQAALPAAVRI